MLSLSQDDFKCCVVHSLQIGLELFLLHGGTLLSFFTLDLTVDILSLGNVLALYFKAYYGS